MIQSPQAIQVAREGVVSDATVAWRYERGSWIVEIEADGGQVEARADDAFEALCVIREQLESAGLRIGVAGAQRDVWPSGMSRDQGGGLVAYRMTAAGAAGMVDTFEPVDPAAVVTVAEQRAGIERLLEESRQQRAHND